MISGWEAAHVAAAARVAKKFMYSQQTDAEFFTMLERHAERPPSLQLGRLHIKLPPLRYPRIRPVQIHHQLL